MQRTFRDVGSRQTQKPTPRSRKLTNAGIVVLSTLLVLTGGVVAIQQHDVGQQVAQAAQTYTPSTTYTPPPVPTKVAFLGDSFTAGSGATSKFNRWTSLLSKEERWLELNYGSGGTNYGTKSKRTGGESYAERLTDLIVSQPDAVIVSSAGNRLDLDQEAGIRSTFQTLREELPDAQIIATSPYYRADEMPAEYEDFAEIIQREVKSVGGMYLDIGHPLLGHPKGMSEDGSHPNDAGYKLIAAAIGKALEEAGVAGSGTAL